MRPMGYTQKAIAGFGWQTSLKILTNLIAVVKIYFLARLLTPNDFGLFSLTAIVLGITESMTQTGINLTIIQSKQSVKYFLDTAWVIAILRGLIIGIIMVLLAMGASSIFNEPRLLPLISVAALIPVIKGFINPAIIHLHKEMKFFRDSLYRFSLVAVGALTAVGLAYLTRSVWSLILALIVSAIWEVIISFLFFKLRPLFNYRPIRGKIIFRNAKWLSFAALFNYLNENIDDFILGKLVGIHQLGLYHNAYALSHSTSLEISKSSYHGTIPILTKIVHDTKRLTRAFIRSFGATIAIALALSIPIYLFPDIIIKLLLGDQWLGAIPLVRPLVIAGIFQAISMQGYTLFLAKKDYLILNFHLAVSLTLMVGLMIILGRSQGLMGAVAGLVIARLVALPIIFWGIKRNLSKL